MLITNETFALEPQQCKLLIWGSFSIVKTKMKFLRLLLGLFCCSVLEIRSLSSKGETNDLGSILDGHSAGHTSFIENRHHSLRIQRVLHRDTLYDSMQCALNCLVTVGCRSFNFKLQAEFDGKHLCELLASDKFNHSKQYIPSTEFHHYSIAVRFPFLCTHLFVFSFLSFFLSFFFF